MGSALLSVILGGVAFAQGEAAPPSLGLGDVVAVFELEAPSIDDFILRGTLL